jgi:tetratricopeptide (TPR) repeat protein
MNKLQMLAAAFAAVQLMSSLPATAAGAEFPGKGNKKDWVRASKLYDQALSQRKRGNIDRAVTMYEEAIKIYPYDADFYLNLAIHYSRDKKNYERAEELVKKAIELKPDAYAFQWELAATYLAQGKLDAGKEVLNKAKSLKKTPEQETELNETLKKIDEAQQSPS